MGLTGPGTRCSRSTARRGSETNYTNPAPDDHNNQVMAINGTALAHGEWTNLLSHQQVRSSNRSVFEPGGGYPGGGQDYVYSGPLATFPSSCPTPW